MKAERVMVKCGYRKSKKARVEVLADVSLYWRHLGLVLLDVLILTLWTIFEPSHR